MKWLLRVLPAHRGAAMTMLQPGVISLASLLCVTALSVTAALAQVPGPKYPDMRAQWTRGDSPAGFDPSKPPGLRQEIPYTPEYQALWEEIVADRRKGGLKNNNTANCVPSGMPRTMTIYETMETIVTPDTTYIRASYMNELRRIYTDGRDWPAKITPSFEGYSIGKWIDEDNDGVYDVLEIETRGLKGPRSYDGNGAPLHKDNQTVIKERIRLDKADPGILYDDITVIDNALTRPWSARHKYIREKQPFWSEYICEEDNQIVLLGQENYFVGSDGYLMPTKKDQPPPDLKYFNQPQK